MLLLYLFSFLWSKSSGIRKQSRKRGLSAWRVRYDQRYYISMFKKQFYSDIIEYWLSVKILQLFCSYKNNESSTIYRYLQNVQHYDYLLVQWHKSSLDQVWSISPTLELLRSRGSSSNAGKMDQTWSRSSWFSSFEAHSFHIRWAGQTMEFTPWSDLQPFKITPFLIKIKWSNS